MPTMSPGFKKAILFVVVAVILLITVNLAADLFWNLNHVAEQYEPTVKN